MGVDGDITIPFNRSSLVGRELEYIFKTMTVGQIAGDQTFTKRCHAFLQERLGVQRAFLTTSCTHALEMSALLLNLQPGDEVIVPSFTFVSTANAFVIHGARPVFADIRPDTLNLDERQVEHLITPRTRAIVPVHYAGVGCEMDRLAELARGRNIEIIEDNAHGLFGKYKGRWLGTFGSMATQSFHETKNFTCGEGGALLVNDPRFIERAEIIREKGTNRSRYFRGQVDKYTWVDVGSSYLMSDVLAAFLFGQLESFESIQTKRRRLWETYDRELASWCGRVGATRPHVPSHCEQAFHMYYLLMPDLASRTELIRHLRARGILAVFHYVPLHGSEMGRRFEPAACPVSESVGDRLVRLPFFNDLQSHEQERVIDALLGFRI